MPTPHAPHIATPHAPHLTTPHAPAHPPSHPPNGSHPPPAGSHPPGSHPAPSHPDIKPPNKGGNGLWMAGGIGLLGAGGAILPGLLQAGTTAGLGAIAGDTAKDLGHTIMNGLENIVSDIGSNPMALGAIVACVGVVAYLGMKK